MHRDKILVTGANGQLGSCIREIEKDYPQYEFIFTDVDKLDITSQSSVEEFFIRNSPNWVINAAAYTAVDRAESDIEMAEKINSTAVGILAQESELIGAGFIHISTDYVFPGDKSSYLTEDDITDPVSVYGKTKLKGEQLAKQNHQCVIIRTSWLYSIYGNNFVKTMRRLGSEKDSINVVSDQWGSPTSAHDLAEGIMKVIENPQYGVFHFSNQGATSWAMFAESIMEFSGLNCSVNHITTDQYPTAATRPKYSLMCCNKFMESFEYTIPDWEISLEKVIGRM